MKYNLISTFEDYATILHKDWCLGKRAKEGAGGQPVTRVA